MQATFSHQRSEVFKLLPRTLLASPAHSHSLLPHDNSQRTVPYCPAALLSHYYCCCCCCLFLSLCLLLLLCNCMYTVRKLEREVG